VTSRRVSPSLASRATRSASGLLERRIAVFRRSRASVSHLGALRALGFLAASATVADPLPLNHGRGLRLVHIRGGFTTAVGCGMIPRHGDLFDHLMMAEQLVPDGVWAAIAPLLPSKPPHPKGGRPWIEDRAVLGGIIYVLRAGVPWRLLPARELGLWKRRELLAATARLATRWRVGSPASSAVGLAGRRRPGRLVPGID
jgi:Putative transposase of IS4/5 family (DUF4096)